MKLTLASGIRQRSPVLSEQLVELCILIHARLAPPRRLDYSTPIALQACRAFPCELGGLVGVQYPLTRPEEPNL